MIESGIGFIDNERMGIIQMLFEWNERNIFGKLNVRLAIYQAFNNNNNKNILYSDVHYVSQRFTDRSIVKSIK